MAKVLDKLSEQTAKDYVNNIMEELAEARSIIRKLSERTEEDLGNDYITVEELMEIFNTKGLNWSDSNRYELSTARKEKLLEKAITSLTRTKEEVSLLEAFGG